MRKANTGRPSPRWSRSGVQLAALNLISIVGLCAVSAFMLWQMRDDAGRQADIASRSFVQTLAREIARNIELFDLSLSAVEDRMLNSEVLEASPTLRRMLLFDNAATAAGFTDVLVIDRDGNISANSQTLGPISGNFSDREYFRYLSSHNTRDLHISGPLISKLTGRQVLVLSRRLSHGDGSFAGVVTGGIELDYLRGLFAMSGADQAGTVTLFGPGGLIVMREPYEAHQIGLSVAQTSSYREIATSRTGSFNGPAMLGQGERRYVFTQVGNLPLHLSTAVSPAVIYDAWRWKALVLGSVVVCLCGTTMILTLLFARELGQKKQAEYKMAVLNAELQTLASTDALTGLANRRRFDEVLEREWHRAVRTGQPLSLIMLDADHFKGFNDRNGHQEGDTVLKLIARSIEAAVDPRHDFACRVGGEEFAVISPGTDAVGAQVVAERIRLAVAGWKVPHHENPPGIVTVSCGLALSSQVYDTKPSGLIALSDAALYKAKQMGRNRTVTAGDDAQRRRVAAKAS